MTSSRMTAVVAERFVSPREDAIVNYYYCLLLFGSYTLKRNACLISSEQTSAWSRRSLAGNLYKSHVQEDKFALASCFFSKTIVVDIGLAYRILAPTEKASLCK